MQTQGSLQEANLASLLQTMQSERATGTLTVENGSDNVALFFLFGHLFHASGPSGEGEDVVIRALGWENGSFHFDPRAKLPAEETIKSSPAELISAAQSGGSAAEVEPAADEAVPDLEAAAEAEESPEETPESTPWATPSAPAAPTPSWSPTLTSTPQPAPWTPQPSPQPEAAPVYRPAEYTPSYAAAAPAAEATPAPAPAPSSAGAAVAAPVGSLPIPDGTVQYEGLKSAFVDFPRLLRTLRSDRHTGYVRLATQSSTGVLLFRDGELVEAEAGEDGDAHGEAAFHIFRRDMDTGQGLIDVVDLDADTVSALARLLTGPPVFTGLLGRFINFDALLEYLAEEELDGSVVVTGGADTGVILLRRGSILAAYTTRSSRAQTTAEAVARLASEKPARIEVRGSDASRGSIDAEAALSRPS
ncbi:MAG: DUF4388 domain-containing protein [Candidatus Dormibacteria bacterium]